MTNMTRRDRGLFRRWTVIAALVAAGALSAPASANVNLEFDGGGFRNYVVDVVFWGPFSDGDRNDVREYIVNFTKLVNGGFNPQGLEPAVHYYGVWGIVPGNWINDPNPINPNVRWGACCSLTDQQIVAEINAAHNGAFGPSRDFRGNVTSNALPAGPNRLAILVTKGMNPLADTNCANLVSHPCVSDAFHNYTNNYPYAGVSYDQGFNVVFPTGISHEIIEAMTDPQPWNGWVTNEGIFQANHREAADSCGQVDPFDWMAISGADISLVNMMTLNPSYGGANNIPPDTCQLWEPQQYAPMGATYEAGGQGGGSRVLNVVYRTPSGRLGQLSWLPGQLAAGPWDAGQPAGGVTAEGKPSIVYSLFGGGEWIFVRGSDNALWMKHNGTWSNLGGVIFGEPSAVIWNNNVNVDVFVLGIDDNLYRYSFVNGVAQGYFTIDNNFGRVFSGPPKVFAKSQTTLDLFAVGENGHLEWIPYSTTNGWSALVDLGNMRGNPHHTPVSITSWGSNRLDIFATSESAVGHRGWNGSWASDYDVRSGELGTTPSGTPAVVSWGINRVDAFMIDRQNRLTHVYYDGSWHPDARNPIRTDAVGDPIALSRGVGQLDVVYRTTSGSLTHLSFNNFFSTTEANILPPGSIQ
jgi:hypothetical protein